MAPKTNKKVCELAKNIRKSTMKHNCANGIVKWAEQSSPEALEKKERSLKRAGFFNKTNEYTPLVCRGHLLMLGGDFESLYQHDKTCLYYNHSNVPNTLPIDQPKPGHIITLEESHDYFEYVGRLIPIDGFVCFPCMDVIDNEINTGKRNAEGQRPPYRNYIPRATRRDRNTFYRVLYQHTENNTIDLKIDEQGRFQSGIPKLDINKNDKLVALNDKFVRTMNEGELARKINNMKLEDFIKLDIIADPTPAAIEEMNEASLTKKVRINIFLVNLIIKHSLLFYFCNYLGLDWLASDLSLLS